MADLTYEILTNREAFPDDRKIVLGDGQEITVKQFRDALMPKSEMTRMTQEWSGKERQLTEAYRGSQQQLAQLQQQLEQAIAARQQADPAPQGRKGKMSLDEMEDDPVLGEFVTEIRSLKRERDEQKKQLDEHNKTLKSYRETWQLANFQNQLERLRSNPDHKDTNWDEFLTYSQRRPVLDTQSNNVDLDATFRNFNYDNAIKAAEARGESRGVEKGKAAAAVPRVPMGRRRVSARPEGVPASFKDVNVDDVLNDPEMQSAMQADHLI